MVSIIIPVLELRKKRNPRALYKRRFTFEDAVDSIARNVQIEHELVVVINDPNNQGLLDYVQKQPTISKHVVNSTNVGVARAWNMGAMMGEGEWLCFCNDDVEVGPGAIERLLEILKSDPTVGQVGPAGGRWHGTESGPRVGLQGIEEADEISGFFFMLPTSVFREVGGADVAYTPAGFEEIDLSFAIRSKGYRCLVVPDTHVVHHGSHGVSSRRTTVRYFDKEIDTVALHKRNKAYFKEKWINAPGGPGGRSGVGT